MCGSLYEEITSTLEALWEETTYDPWGFSLNPEDVRRLTEWLGFPRVSRNKLDNGTRITMLHTEFGQVRLLPDSRVPEGKLMAHVTGRERVPGGKYWKEFRQAMGQRLQDGGRPTGSGGSVLPDEGQLPSCVERQDDDKTKSTANGSNVRED